MTAAPNREAEFDFFITDLWHMSESISARGQTFWSLNGTGIRPVLLPNFHFQLIVDPLIIVGYVLRSVHVIMNLATLANHDLPLLALLGKDASVHSNVATKGLSSYR